MPEFLDILAANLRPCRNPNFGLVFGEHLFFNWSILTSREFVDHTKNPYVPNNAVFFASQKTMVKLGSLQGPLFYFWGVVGIPWKSKDDEKEIFSPKTIF